MPPFYDKNGYLIAAPIGYNPGAPGTRSRPQYRMTPRRTRIERQYYDGVFTMKSGRVKGGLYKYVKRRWGNTARVSDVAKIKGGIAVRVSNSLMPLPLDPPRGYRMMIPYVDRSRATPRFRYRVATKAERWWRYSHK